MVGRALAAFVHGDMGALAAPWADWKMVRGELFAPGGEGFTPGQVLAGRLWRDLADEQRRELAKVRAELVELRGKLATAASAIEAAEAELVRVANAAPLRVQLVAIDQDGRQTALCAPVAPMVLVAARGRLEPDLERDAVPGGPHERVADLDAHRSAYGVGG